MTTLRATVPSILRVLLYSTVLVTIAFNVHLYWSRSSQPAAAAIDSGAEWFSPPRTVDLSAVTDDVRGAPGMLTVIEIADFECPFCARSALEVGPYLRKELARAGSGNYLFFNYPLQRLHANALAAAQAVECARAQNRFWEMYRELFTPPVRLHESDLHEHARRAGLESSAFTSCFTGETRPIISAQIAAAERLGVAATPTFVFGRFTSAGQFAMVSRVSGLRPPAVFAEVIRRARAE